MVPRQVAAGASAWTAEVISKKSSVRDPGPFRRAVFKAEPLFVSHHACFWKTAADNLMASFERVEDAVAVARELARLDLSPSAFCLAVGYGRILQLEDDVFGDEVNVTFKLGEDVAKRGQVLVSQGAMQALGAHEAEGPLYVEAGESTITYYKLRF